MLSWSLRTKIVTGLSAAAAFIFLAAASGVIGNAVYAFLPWVEKQAGKLVQMNTWPWIILVIVLLLCLCACVYWWDRSSNAIKTLTDVCDLDDSLFRLLSILIATSNDREAHMQRLMKELLRDATRPFGRFVHRASIFLPDMRTGGDYLFMWATYQMPAESASRTRFYIGKEPNRARGIAGETFLDAQIRVGHIIEDKAHQSRWKCDQSCYVVFDKDRPFPPYRSMIAVPIIGLVPDGSNGISNGCLGVLCFDSEHPTIFDNPATRQLLLVFGRRIAAALLIYQKLPQEGNRPVRQIS